MADLAVLRVKDYEGYQSKTETVDRGRPSFSTIVSVCVYVCKHVCAHVYSSLGIPCVFVVSSSYFYKFPLSSQSKSCKGLPPTAASSYVPSFRPVPQEFLAPFPYLRLSVWHLEVCPNVSKGFFSAQIKAKFVHKLLKSKHTSFKCIIFFS